MRQAPATAVRVSQRPSPRELVAVGLDHRTASIELRERLAFTDAETASALRQLTDAGGGMFEQAAVLSTCNRVELYGVARARPSQQELTGFLARFHRVDTEQLADVVYVHRGDEVARHLAATAAGMHSLVLGEAQIQGQVRTALKHALWTGTAGPELRRLFESAIAAGRRVRSETAIGRGVASVPQASVELARRRLGSLDDTTTLLIGAGNTAELAAKQLLKRRARVLILGRNPRRAERLAERYGARAITADQLSQALAACDVVVTATDAPHPILYRDQLEPALAHRSCAHEAPLLLIDLAVPRDIDPSVAGLAGVAVYTLDDLKQVVERTLSNRSAELPAAESVVRAEVSRFTDWLRRRETVAR